jgi:hypothetical protein
MDQQPRSSNPMYTPPPLPTGPPPKAIDFTKATSLQFQRFILYFFKEEIELKAEQVNTKAAPLVPSRVCENSQRILALLAANPEVDKQFCKINTFKHNREELVRMGLPGTPYIADQQNPNVPYIGNAALDFVVSLTQQQVAPVSISGPGSAGGSLGNDKLGGSGLGQVLSSGSPFALGSSSTVGGAGKSSIYDPQITGTLDGTKQGGITTLDGVKASGASEYFIQQDKLQQQREAMWQQQAGAGAGRGAPMGGAGRPMPPVGGGGGGFPGGGGGGGFPAAGGAGGGGGGVPGGAGRQLPFQPLRATDAFPGASTNPTSQFFMQAASAGRGQAQPQAPTSYIPTSQYQQQFAQQQAGGAGGFQQQQAPPPQYQQQQFAPQHGAGGAGGGGAGAGRGGFQQQAPQYQQQQQQQQFAQQAQMGRAGVAPGGGGAAPPSMFPSSPFSSSAFSQPFGGGGGAPSAYSFK